MKYKKFVLVLTVAIGICTGPLSATLVPLVPPDINGTSTATPITGGPRDGWYLYEMDIQWNLDGPGAGLSHWELVLLVDCKLLDHLIEFDTPAGYSTSEGNLGNPEAMGWTGYFNRDGDPPAGISNPVVKYNDPFYPDTAEPGEEGFGTFSFYANIIPEYGTFEGMLFAKSGSGVEDVFGDLQGAIPSCTIIPEPATICLLGLGALALLRKRRI